MAQLAAKFDQLEGLGLNRGRFIADLEINIVCVLSFVGEENCVTRNNPTRNFFELVRGERNN